MNETAAEYTARILGYVGDRDALATLEETPAVLTRLVSNIDHARLAHKPTPAKWSVQEILAHLADSELVLSYRVRLILSADGATIEAYDQNRWAAAGRYEQIPPQESLNRIHAERVGNLRLLRSLRPNQMEQYGIHSERGKESITHVTRMWAGHDINHRRQIEAILGK
jgi:hypothetical protein